MKRTLLVLALLFFLFAPQASRAQTNFQQFVSQSFLDRALDRQMRLDFRRVGSEALGMGGAGVARSSSVMASSWNPAGLAFVTRREAAFNGGFNLNTQEITVQRFAGVKVLSEIDPKLLPAFAGLSYPLRLGGRNLTLGFAYQRLMELSQKNTETFYIYPTGTIDHVETPHGNLYALVPSVALTLTSKLALGLSYHLLHGKSDYRFEVKSPYIDEFVFYGFKDEEAYDGKFLVAGLQFKPKEWLALGVTVTPSWKYTIAEKRESLFVITNLIGTSVEGDTLITPPDSLQKSQLETPLFYELGLAVKPMARLTLAFDFAARPWSKAAVSANGVAAQAHLLDAHSMRFGLEYLARTKWAEVPLRFGYYTNPSPYKDRFF
ncbi:MAG: hypothetical protein AAB354_07330, partial [candidate division KSB1 bacterium]